MVSDNFNIDILLATYNGGRYISDQIDSLLSQTNKSWRLLVHDDGSIDRTIDILKKYQSEHPEKIVLLDDNVRCGGAKNNFLHLLMHSSAPYVMFCDQDDIWHKDKVDITYRRMLEEENKHPNRPVLVHTDLSVVDEELNVISDSMFKYQRLQSDVVSLDQILFQNNVTGCTMMVNRRAISVSLPMPSEAIMHDWWMACKVMQQSGIISLISCALIQYRQHGYNEVGSKKVDFRHYFSQLLSFNKSLRTLLAAWRQARKIKKDLRFSKFAFTKVKMVLRRVFYEHK